jgi:hypothetical protein
MKHPYAVPARLPPGLDRVLGYWKSLLRGSAEMPFWDDAKLTDLPDLLDRTLLIDVFDRPERFRLNSVGAGLGQQTQIGRFLDEADLDAPFDFLASQCSATVEAAAATCYVATDASPFGDRGFARLLLPMWGEGRIGMLLGAVEARSR